MIVGEFHIDLEQYLKLNNGEFGSSKKSQIDLDDRKNLSSLFLDVGKMYNFRYFTEEEPIFDSNPIILYLGLNKYKNITGINLHYIPYKERILFLKQIWNDNTNHLITEIQSKKSNIEQDSIDDLIWENIIRDYGRYYNLKYAIRQYRFDRIKNLKCLGYEDWYIGAVNNENYFVGSTIKKEQSLYYFNK